MTTKIRWGILSTARIGRARVIPAIQQSCNGEVVAVASRSLDSARAFADANNIPTAHGSYQALLDDPNIDAIYNPLPNSLHAAWSIASAEAGKPMLCEKPLAHSAAKAQAMVDAFKNRDIPFAEAFMYRFHPQTERVKELVDKGIIGQIQIISAAFTFNVRSEANIRLSADLAGGALMDVGCYCVSIMRLLTGEEPIEAQAIGLFGDVDEALVGVLGFPSGVLGHFDCGLRTYRAHMVEIRGSEGRIGVKKAFGPDVSERFRVWRGSEYKTIAVPPANHYQLMVEDFADAILDNRPPRFDPQDGVENMKVIERLLAAARGA